MTIRLTLRNYTSHITYTFTLHIAFIFHVPNSMYTTVPTGSAVLFYNLKHGCDGVNPSCVDEKTRHAGLMPTKGEKWVATKVSFVFDTLHC